MVASEYQYLEVISMSSEPKSDTYSKEPENIRTTLFDKFFHDRNGRIVLAQAPNLPLICWLVVTLLKLVFPTGKIGTQLDAIAFGLLFTWAWEEIFQGVNYFRRTLGVIVLVVAIAGYVSRS